MKAMNESDIEFNNIPEGLFDHKLDRKSEFFLWLNRLLKESKYLRKLNLSLNEKYLASVIRQNYFPFVEGLQCKILKTLQNKKKLRAVFFVVHESVWQYEDVYRMMLQDALFEPLIIVVPYRMYGKENMISDMNKAYTFFSNNGYEVRKAYNEELDTYLDVYKEYKPDFVFFTNPYDLTESQYYIEHWYDKALCCYVPYGIMSANIQEHQYNQLFHNLIWRHFYETDIHKQMAEKYAFNKGRNVFISGYPKCDIFLDHEYERKDVWKIKDKSVKRVIWAPHHTIEDGKDDLSYSNFIEYSDFVLNLCEKYKDKLQIAFKPHPLLKVKLYGHPFWGKEKTDEYYSCWENLENGQLEEDVYIDLFLTSDAMIFDSISFMTEYIYTKKPPIFMVRDENTKNKFNEFGQNIFKILYKSYSMNSLEEQIVDIIISNNDTQLARRMDFFEKYLSLRNLSSSEYIIDNLRGSVRNAV